jgi:hypothetical protein
VCFCWKESAGGGGPEGLSLSVRKRFEEEWRRGERTVLLLDIHATLLVFSRHYSGC